MKAPPRTGRAYLDDTWEDTRVFAKMHPDWCTLEEFHCLLQLRRDYLEHCTRAVTGGPALPVPWRTGWKARIVSKGRDRDGSCLAMILISGPGEADLWRQNVRLVRKQRLYHNFRDRVARRFGPHHTEKR